MKARSAVLPFRAANFSNLKKKRKDQSRHGAMSAADAAIRRGPGARPQRDLPVPLLTHGVESSNQTCRIGRRCMTLKTLHDAPNNPTKAINVKRLDKTKQWRRISRRSNRPLNPTCAKQPSPGAMPASPAPRLRLAAYCGADIASFKLLPAKKDGNRLPMGVFTPST